MGPRMRYQDWPERLHQIVADSHVKPFAWGQHDCCLFAANVVMELIGVDPAAELRGTYSTALEAARILKDRGGVREIASTVLHEIPPMTAQRGDVVMVHTDAHGDALAVCLGAHCAAPGVESLQYLPMSRSVAAWRVV